MTVPSRGLAEVLGDVRAIRREIEVFEENVEHKGEWRFECSADDLQMLGWARVLCDIALGEADYLGGSGG